MARFDWYQGSVRGSPADLISSLSALDFNASWEVLDKAPMGYHSGQRLVDDDGQVCAVFWGTKHAHPHVVGSGETAPRLAHLLRSEWAGRHSVSRADACIDFPEPGAYDRLQDLALSVAQDHGIKVGTAGDHLLTLKGRTVYFGATSSHTRVRIYDKAEELRSKFDRHLVKLLEVPDHLTRLEVQVRPETPQGKETLAGLEPLETWGSAVWTRDLMKRVTGEDLKPVQVRRTWRQSDDAGALATLVHQYGKMLKRMSVKHGGNWAAVGERVGAAIEENELLKRCQR